jgi:hypothetical protein
MHSRVKSARSGRTRGKIKPPDLRSKEGRASPAGGTRRASAATVDGKIKPPD